MQLTTARKIASKALVTPADFSAQQSARIALRKARKRRRAQIRKARNGG